MGPRAFLYPVLLDRKWLGCIAAIGNQRKGTNDLSIEEKELPLLAWVMGALLENQRLWKILEKLDRQFALGFLSAGIIHEIRNPLTALSTLVQLLPQKRNDPAFMDSFQPLMLKELDRLKLLTDQSLQFARTGTPIQGMVDLQETLERISQLIRPSLGLKRIQLRLKIEPGIKIKVDPAQLESLIVNLLKNALSAVRDKGFIQVPVKRTFQGGKKNKNWICLSVKDNGKGIDAKEMDRIFDPYFTTNPEGTGLGLAICRRVVENYGGILKVSSKRGQGSVFSAYFPSNSD
jgi:two-component system sensor histidine kinase AtoS